MSRLEIALLDRDIDYIRRDIAIRQCDIDRLTAVPHRGGKLVMYTSVADPVVREVFRGFVPIPVTDRAKLAFWQRSCLTQEAWYHD